MPENPLNKLPDNPFNKEKLTSIIGRAKELIADPAATWHDIDEEAKSPRQILLEYAMPLAAVGPLAGLVGALLFGYGALGFSGRLGFGSAVGMAVASFVLSIVSLYVVAWIANKLSPRAGGRDDFNSAFRLTAYAMTVAWAAGIFSLFPPLSILGFLGLYSIYIFYTGVRPMLGVTDEQAAGYTIWIFVAAVVVYIVTGAMVTRIGGVPAGLI